jgi:hypothetical protein
MIGDLAYDRDPLDQRLRQRGVRLIAPHKGNPGRARASPLLSAAGRSNACWLGCITFAVWSSLGSFTRPTSAWSSSVASSS